MSIFACSRCGAAENTAATHGWIEYRLKRITGPLCSECYSGTWHGIFPKRQAADSHPYVDRNGMLWENEDQCPENLRRYEQHNLLLIDHAGG